MIKKEYFMQRKISLVIVTLLLLVGSIIYFAVGLVAKSQDMNSQSVKSNLTATQLELYKNI